MHHRFLRGIFANLHQRQVVHPVMTHTMSCAATMLLEGLKDFTSSLLLRNTEA